MNENGNHPEPLNDAQQQRLAADLRRLYTGQVSGGQPASAQPGAADASPDKWARVDNALSAMARERLDAPGSGAHDGADQCDTDNGEDTPDGPIVIKPRGVSRWKWLGGAVGMAAALTLVAYMMSPPPRPIDNSGFGAPAVAGRDEGGNQRFTATKMKQAPGTGGTGTDTLGRVTALLSDLKSSTKPDIVLAQRLALAVSGESVTDLALDFNSDGRVDFGDVDTLALRAVAVSPQGVKPAAWRLDTAEFWMVERAQLSAEVKP